MIVDSTDLAGATELSADVVVVGAGPAGIVASLELSRAGKRVLLCESGHARFDADVQQLGDEESGDPRRHTPMSLATRRQIGGTSVIWGGRCVPYDPVDFDARPHVPEARWPITYADVAPFFQRACDWLRCGEATFGAQQIPKLAGRTMVEGLQDGGIRTSDLERWSLPTNFGREYRRELRKAQNLRLVTRLTATEISVDASGRATHLVTRDAAGRRIVVRAPRIVIAAGGLESTRLLLASDQAIPGGLGNHSGHLGRWFMTHVDGTIADIRFHGPPSSVIHAHERDHAGVYVRRRFSFSRELQTQERLPNIVAWLANPRLPDAAHGSGVLSFAYLALRSPVGRRAVSPTIRASMISGSRSPVWPHVRNVVRDFGPASRFALEFGFKRFLARRRAPGFFVRSQSNRYLLHYHGEQVPNRTSMVTLGEDRDAVGLRRLRLDLRFSQADVDGVIRAHKLWDQHLRASRAGHLEYADGELESLVWNQLSGGCHQMGTTRMSARASDGVVDEMLKVHGIDGVYVASSSVFPSSSQANSTFLVVAMALRLADHLGR